MDCTSVDFRFWHYQELNHFFCRTAEFKFTSLLKQQNNGMEVRVIYVSR